MKNITPKHLECTGYACPKIFEDGKNYIIVGEKTTEVEIANNESAVRVPKSLLADLKN